MKIGGGSSHGCPVMARPTRITDSSSLVLFLNLKKFLELVQSWLHAPHHLSLSLSLSLSRNQRGYTSYPPFVITWSLANPTWLGGYFANYPLFFPIFYVGFLFFSFLFSLVTPTPPHAMITAFFFVFFQKYLKKIEFFYFFILN